MPIYDNTSGGGGFELPEDGSVGDVLTLAEDGAAWGAAPNVFRGAWQADTLAKQYDFASGIDPVFATVVSANGTAATASAVAVGGSYGAPGPFTQGARVAAQSQSDGLSLLELDLAATGIKNISRVSAWVHVLDAFSTFEDYMRMASYRNGVLATESDVIMPWKEIGTPADSNDVVRFGIHGTINLGTETIYGEITGLKIFTVSSPYMLGDFVTYAGKMWKSDVDNNGNVPGVGGTWVEALILPKASGTTGQRPSPATAGAGYPYFDTTLVKPIWSDGASWVDATGTAV